MLKNILKIILIVSLLQLSIGGQLLRSQRQNIIQELKYSALTPDNLEIVLPESLEINSYLCPTLILNDHLCKVKYSSNSTITCNYPIYLFEEENNSNIHNDCKLSCQDQPGCSLLKINELKQNVATLDSQLRKLVDNDLFSFSPLSGSFVYPSYLTIDLKSINKKITKITLLNGQAQSDPLVILKQDSKQVVCLVKGVKIGEYKVQLLTEANELIESTTLFKIEVIVTSIAPNQGSVEGGVILTIKGENFSIRDEENLVKIGDVPCSVISSSSTQIECITQKPENNPPTLNQEYDLVVYFGDQLSKASDNNAKFTFIQVNTKPSITNIGSNVKGKFIQGEQIVITGENLKIDGQETVLRIGEFSQEIQSLTPTELKFTIGFDMPNFEQVLTIHVGINGSTEGVKVVTPSMMISSECIKQAQAIYRDYYDTMNKLTSFIYFDLELSNYDPTYKTIVTFDGSSSYEAKVSQSSGNKNNVFVRVFDNSYASGRDYNEITSIKIGGDEILDAPLTINYIDRTNGRGMFENLSLIKLSDTSFSIQYTAKENDLVIYQAQIRTSDYSQQILATISTGFLSFNLLPLIQDYQYQIIVEGYSNYGSFSERVNVKSENYFIFKQAKQQLTILDNPFPQNVVYPGQTFKVKLEQYVPISDFLNVECLGNYFPIFSETELNSDNIYEFRIPPLFIPDNNAQVTCSLQLRSQWSSIGDQYMTKHSIQSENLLKLQQYILQFTMIESIDKIIIAYTPSNNIVINSITPPSISYIGGEILEFRGKNLQNSSSDKVEILINGITCQVVEATTSSIKCISGFQNKMLWLEESYISVYVNGVKAKLEFPPLNIVFRQVDPIPFIGFLEFNKSDSKVFIPKYYSIIMDDITLMHGKTVNYDRVLVDGSWVFLSSISYDVVLNRLIGLGSILIGTEASPFGQETLKLTVNDETNIASIAAFSTDKQTFINLTETALKDQKILKLKSSDITLAKLKVGDELIITGTTLETLHETVKIASISGDSITLVENLTYDHIVASELLKAQDGTSINFNVIPTVTKINKSVQMILNNLDKGYNDMINYSVPTRNFFLKGINFKLNQDKVYSYSFSLSSEDSNLNMIINYSPCFSALKLQNNIFQSMSFGCFALNIPDIEIKSNIFLHDSDISFYLQNDSRAQFTNNIFQKVNLIVQHSYPKSNEQQLTLKDNVIYNVNRCLHFETLVESRVPLLMENNICFSCNEAFSLNGFAQIESTGFYFIAVDIKQAALVSARINHQAFTDYQFKIKGRAFLQSKLTNSANSAQKPVAFRQTQSLQYSTLLRLYFENIEFKGFKYADTDYLVENQSSPSNQILTHFKGIKQDFTGILFPDLEGLVIRDLDGSFSGVGKLSNIFANSINLHDDTASCVNKAQYSICQNSLIHFINIQALWHLYQESNNFLTLKRSNNKIVQGSKYGFFIVNGETYSAQVLDSQQKEMIFQLISLQLDYTQDETKGIVISYPIGQDYIYHSVIKILVANLKQLLFVQDSDYYEEQAQTLDPNSCSHGQSYYDGLTLQVCYKAISLPVTVAVSYYPEVYPIVTRTPIESKIRDFTTQKDWFESLINMKTSKRWTILSHWKMTLTKSGTYTIPTLVIQGSLEISGDANIIINVRGIYIGAGSLTVSSSFTGKLTINFVSQDASEVIFNNPYEEAVFKEGYIVNNNKLSIENSKNNLKSYRVVSYNTVSNQQVKNQIIVKGVTLAEVLNGDEIFIVSPKTGEYVFTTINQAPSQFSNDQVLLTLKDNLSFTFSDKFDTFQANSKNILLTPYVKIFRKRIQINNFKIVSLSHGNKFIPSISLKGVYLENSSVATLKIVSKISLEDCVFNAKKDDNFIFNNQQTVYYQNNQLYSPTFSFINNLLVKSMNSIKLELFYKYNPSSNLYYDTYPYNANIQYKIDVSKNIIVDSDVALYSYYISNLSENIIIKATKFCSSSPQCQTHTNDYFYLCQESGINYDNCDNATNLSVAFSGTFFSGKVRSVQNVVSISNKVHFKPFAGYYDKNIPLNKYDVVINQSIIISDLVEQGEVCTPSKAIQLFTPQDDFIQVPAITVSNSYFYNFQCSTGITFQTDTPLNEIYHSSLVFKDTYCKNCLFAKLTDLIDTKSQVPPSFLVQDYKSQFLGQNPNELTSYIFTSQIDDPFIKIQQSEDILGRLFLRKLQKNNNLEFTLSGNTYNTQQISEKQGSVFVFPLNKLFPLETTSYNQIALRLSSHNLQSLEFIQLSLKVGKEKGLKIRQKVNLLLPTLGLDSSDGYEILKLVKQDESKIKCGVNIYDPKEDVYHLIITNDPECLINLFEYSTTKVFIVIPTPILPPPPPEEINMCLAQRQMLYVINRISALLGIDKRRIKMRSQSNLNSCKLGRLLLENSDEPEEISFSFTIDTENSDNETSCTFNPECSEQEKQNEDATTSQANLQTYQSLQTLQEKAIESGFVINSIQATLPPLVSGCQQDQFYQDSTCVSSCTSNYYPSTTQTQKVCVKCHAACKTCIGSTNQDCTAVQNSQSLDCSANYSTFTNNDGKKYCGKCPSNCKMDCKLLISSLCPETQCEKGFVNQNGYCLKQCATNFFNKNDKGICKKCMSYCKNQCNNGQCECNDGFYPLKELQDEVCAACPQDCATCTSEKECKTCTNDKFDEKFLCQVEKYIPEESSDSQFGLIIGLTFGIGASFIFFIFLIKYCKTKKQDEYKVKVNTDELQTEQEFNHKQITVS